MFFKTCAVGLCFRPHAVSFQLKCVYDMMAFIEICMILDIIWLIWINMHLFIWSTENHESLFLQVIIITLKISYSYSGWIYFITNTVKHSTILLLLYIKKYNFLF